MISYQKNKQLIPKVSEEEDVEELLLVLMKQYPDYYNLRGRRIGLLDRFEVEVVNQILKSEFID